MLTGEKVYLSSVEMSSIEKLREWRNTPALRRYFRECREISKDMQEKWYLERVRGNSNQVDFEIHGKENGLLVGHCGLYYINWMNRTAELTIYLGETSVRGLGYGKDALTLLMDYAFDTLNLNRVWCEVFDNNGAVEVYRKIGFKDEGVLRQHHFDEGRYMDCYVLGLLAHEWRERRDSATKKS